MEVSHPTMLQSRDKTTDPNHDSKRAARPPRLHPFAFLESAWRHRRLILRLARRRVEAVYRGSVLGLTWAFLYPLLLLGVYTFVFSVVFQLKWGSRAGSNAEFALFLFSGMILYSVFSQCVNEAPQLIRSHQIYIKQLVFPSEILPLVSVASSLFTFLLSGAVLGVFYLWLWGLPPLTVLCLPLVMLPLLLLSLAASWLLSALSVFIEDVNQFVGLVTMTLLFLSPIFYSVDTVPEAWRDLYCLNPLATILSASKDVLFYGRLPDWSTLGSVTGACWVGSWLAWICFVKTRKSFADVL